MFTVRQDQMNAIADATFERVLARVAGLLREDYPELPLQLGEAPYLAWVREVLEGGAALNITREDNLLSFAEWHALAGLESSLAEEFPWALDVLRDTDADEDLRVEEVELRLQGLAPAEALP